MDQENVKDELTAINELINVQSDLGEGVLTSMEVNPELVKSGMVGLGGYVWKIVTKIATWVVKTIYSIAIYIIFNIFIFFC